MKKLKETNSPLLNRSRVELEIEHSQKSTPTKEDLKKDLAKELKVTEDTIDLKHIFSHFGSSKSKIIADVYKTKEDLKKYVKIKKKKKEEEATAPAPEAKKAEAPKPEEKKEEKPVEAKKEEVKEEKKNG